MNERNHAKPQWYSSYQGETHYYTGAYVSGQGTPNLVCRHLLDYYNLESLNYPETFWGTLMGLVGAVRWGYIPYVQDCHQRFPDAGFIATHLPDYVPARYTADYSAIEYDGEPPVLIATSSGFRSLKEATSHAQQYPTLAELEAPWWTGAATDMTKDLWFAVVFPRLPPQTRANIVAFLVKKGIELPTLIGIPDKPYVHYRGQQRWVIKRSPPLQPTLYFNQETGWTERETQATTYYSEPTAQTALAAARAAKS